jgi:hypothetical protein
MELEQLVIDQPLDQVEDTPAGEEEAEVGSPRRCEFAALPGNHQEDRRREDKDPGRQVEEPVDERVRLQPGDRVHPLSAVVAGEHVVPLQDLMEHDAIDEPAKPEAQDKCGCARRRHRRSAYPALRALASHPLRSCCASQVLERALQP